MNVLAAMLCVVSYYGVRLSTNDYLQAVVRDYAHYVSQGSEGERGYQQAARAVCRCCS